MKNYYLYLIALLSLFATNLILADNAYDYKKHWDLRVRISDNGRDGKYLYDIERNEEKTDWEAEPGKVVQSLFATAKAGDFKSFSALFDSGQAKPEEMDKFYKWLRPFADYWLTMDVLALGQSSSDPNLVFFAVVSGEEPISPPVNYDHDAYSGFKKVIYLRKKKNSWTVDLKFNDKKLELLLNDEVFLSRCGISLPFDEVAKEARKLAEKKIFEKKKKIEAEIMEQEELESFLSTYSKYYPKEDLERKYKLLKAMREPDIELCACKTLKDEFVYMLKKGMIKVFEMPIVISNIGAPLEDGLSDSNPFDFIRKNLYEGYTEPDRTIKWPSGIETMSENYYRKHNLKTFQITYYTTLEFDGESYCQLSGLLYNSDNILGGKCVEKQFELKRYIGNKWDFAYSQERPSFLNEINQTNACLDHIINRDNTKEELLYGLTGSGFKEKLEKYGLYPIFWIHKPEECIQYKPEMDLESIPILKIDEKTFKSGKK